MGKYNLHNQETANFYLGFLFAERVLGPEVN